MKRLVRGARLGKYRLERRLGEGASASVWRARDTVEGRRVALKIVLPGVVQEFGRAAIEAEARIAARLEHPCVVGIRNADWIEGHFVLVTELAIKSLDQYAGARRSAAVALSILRDVAEGLGYAHEQGVLHRDIKPANILIFAGRRAKLGDFGTARLAPQRTRLQTEVGTLGYMAPEQAYGRPRFASDVFSLALTGYELLCGTLPGWPFAWPLEGHERFARRCPAPVQPVLRRALERDVPKRFRDGVEFHRALVRALERAEAGASRAPARSRARRAGPAADPFAMEARWFRRRFGRALDARFDCHACGGPIAEAMGHCPWCGTDRNSFIEITSYPLVCPECERGVRPEWSACPWCAQGRFEPNGEAVPLDRKAERPCPRPGCEGQLRPFMRYCPVCKAKVQRPWKLEGLAPCRRCRWPVAPRWRYCAWCGRRNDRALSVR